tara:strand:+ start:568 stop:1509 length:942 start_codon:yes stop_codon:yes gene_type:complete
MEITNNSTIDSVMDFANVKFGMELTKDEVSTQLRELTFSETLKLLNSIKADDGDAFSEIINMSVEESYSDDFDYDGTWEDDCSTCKGTGWERVSSDEDERACDDCNGTGKVDEAVANEEQINEIDPSRSPWTQNGKHPGAMDADELRNELAVFDELRDRGDYLSPRELAQEDSLWNYLLQVDGPQVDEASKELARLIELTKHGIDEIPEAYGTISTAQPSRATINAQGTKPTGAERRYNNTAQDQARDANVIPRTVAGLRNPQPTGTGASRAGSVDPDDIERAQNSEVAAQNQNQTITNAQEIERLRQLALGQ